MSVQVTFAADPRHTAPLRRVAGAYLSAHGVEEHSVSELLVVLTELVTNAVTASGGPGSVVAFSMCFRGPGMIEIDVSDDGPGFELGVPLAPSPEQQGGRGLVIAKALTDSLSVSRRNGRTHVLARRRVTSAGIEG